MKIDDQGNLVLSSSKADNASFDPLLPRPSGDANQDRV